MERFEYYNRIICAPIEQDGLVGIDDFQVREGGGFLAGYLKAQAKRDEKENLARTYIVRDAQTDQIVAYFSLKAGFVAANDRKLIQAGFDTAPGIEISNFAVNSSYVKIHPSVKGIGQNIFSWFILPIAKKAQEIIGVHFIYIFALPNKELIAHYEKWGFSRLSRFQERLMHRRIRPRYDNGCIFMYQAL